MKIEMASSLATVYVHMVNDLVTPAKDFEANGIKPRDALHFACALKGKADYFVTCDDKLMKKSGFMKNGVRIVNPVDFVRHEVK